MTTNYHTAISVGAAANAATFNTPLGALDAAITNAQSGVYNVLDYGAVGDGTTDDTTAVQACINAAISSGDPASVTRYGQGVVYLPAGTYRITAPLVVQSVLDFAMRGDGKATILHADGTFAEVLDLNGVFHSIFADFTITSEADAAITRAVWYRWTGMHTSTAQNAFYNIVVRDCIYTKAAFELGDAANQNVEVNQDFWYNCTAAGWWTTGEATNYQNGFYVGDGVNGNNLLHFFYGCSASANRYNLRVDHCQCAWYGGQLQGAEIDCYVSGTAFFKVSGVRSEGSTRFFSTAGGNAAWASNFSIEDVYYCTNDLNVDNKAIIFRFGGTLYIQNLWMNHTLGSTSTPIIDINNGGTYGSICVINGASSQTAAADFVVCGSASNKVYMVGYVQMAGDQAAGAVDSVRTNLPISIDQSDTAGAKPVLTVDQADVSEEFIRFIGTSTTDDSQSLIDAADMEDPGSIVGWLKIYVQDDQATNPITDGAYYIPFYSAPTHSA